ncbi:MAG TPA: DUF6132 family protein [Oscillospiraceae bacterium]|mgnify:CR=1 FL=1|nr:DUF6132 family protein [Oscillospiraceae bacterium]
MIYKYLIGAVIGGLVGYFVLYKLIGCSTGACPITANPFLSTIYGIVLGLLVTALVIPSPKPAENNSSISSAQSMASAVNSVESVPSSSAASMVTSENTAESKPSTNGISSAAAVYRKISAQDAKARMDSGDKIIIVDVRTQSEFDAGHIPNAILIPNETIIDTKPELLPDLNAGILVCCRSGNRSAQAAKKLIAIGYTNVYDFGGIIDWPYDTITK